jgi:hypothetical protein
MMGLLTENYLKSLLSVILILLSGAGVVSLQLPRIKLQEKQLTKEEYLQKEQATKVSLDLLKKMPSFGFDNLLADWVFLDFIQYFGDNQAREKTGHSLSGDYFDFVVKKDPRFVLAYLLLDPATTLFAGQPQKSVAIMSEGVKFLSPQLPLSYSVWVYKGVNELLFLGDTKAAQKSYQTAANWASFHHDQSSRRIKQRAEETAQFLAKNPNSKQALISSWLLILGNARDQQTQQLAITQIKKLGGKVIITPNSISVKVPQGD